MTFLETALTTDLRDRILSEAYRLVAQHGVSSGFLEDVAQAADVDVAEIALRFPDEHVLLLAALEHSTRQWAGEIGAAIARTGVRSAEERLLALFTVYEERFGRSDFDAIGLMRVLSEAGRFQKSGSRMLGHLEQVRREIASLAAEAGLRDAEDFALACHVLLKAAIVSAIEGDVEATHRAERMARALIAEHRPEHERPEDSIRLEQGDDSEWLVVSDLATRRGERALAVIRRERAGYTCYPNAIGFARLGPYATLDEALDAAVTHMTPGAAR